MPKRIIIRKAPKVLAVLAAMLIVGACGSTTQARSITLTFIRNAQSQADADGVIDTEVPGPDLTTEGKGQARQIVRGHTDFDSIYASSIAATQQTAAPLASELGKQVEVLPGLQSIDAGWYNGKPETMANSTYMVAPADWLNGDVNNSIPGSITGSEFNAQFTAAVRKIYDSGHNNPVAFSQGEAIMVWTLMNARNTRNSLLTSHPLPNVGRVVITGNPLNGWKLVDWDGIRDFG